MQDFTDPNPRAVSGGNNPPEPTTEYEKLHHRQTELVATASAWLNECPVIKNQAEADACAGFMKQLSALKKDADEQRKVEKRPHDEAAKAVHTRWMVVVDACTRALDLIEPKQTAWLQAEKARNAEEERKAREAAEAAQREADRQREEAEAAIRRAEMGDAAGSGENTVAKVIAAESAQRDADAAQKQARTLEGARPRSGGQFMSGGIKRSVGLRAETTLRVSDLRAAAAYFAADNAPELVEACEKAARRIRKAYPDRDIPGITVETTERARV